MVVVGLTGGIGAGKTAVTDVFAQLGVPIIDADLIAKELVVPGQSALREIVAAFSADILTSKGMLDRRKLRYIVFRQPRERKRLERILHPLVRAEIEKRIKSLVNAPYCVVCIPLLLETNQIDLVDRLLVVDVAEDVQFERVRIRDQLTDADIETIVDVQWPRQKRLQFADDVVVNDSDKNTLAKRVESLHYRYLKLAKKMT